jgi:NAD(P)-dependent dehydrogenase (short-subunit alcohol dehydrogenase family)
LVSGAAGGLGRGIAVALAEAGADVALVDLSSGGLAEVAEAVRGRGRSAYPLVADVTDPARLAEVVDELQHVDVLVNSAGTNVPEPFVDVRPETFERLFAINVRGAFLASQAVVRQLLRRESAGAIVNVSSQMGHVGAANRVVYCATKHAVEGMTKAMGVELAPHGIRVNAIAPTYITTPLTEPFFANRVFRDDTLARIPLGRLGRVEDVTAAAVFLASPAAALITGTSLLIDGGYTAQ